MRKASNISREALFSIGTCVGKMTHGGKFHLTIQFLDHLAKHAKFKVWVKPGAEMAFLYGNHVPKQGMGRITEGCPQYAGVVVCSMRDTPLGFGIAGFSTEQCHMLEPTATVVLHQADIGEYLRDEQALC
jgi:60S ribosome subunit biogenesis protein NIP7